MPEERPRVGVIHATPAAMDPVRAAFAADLPGVIALHFLDEGLWDGVNREGRLTPGLIRRLATVVGQADSAGVQAILATCSAYSPVMDTMRTLASIPIVTIDEVLFEESVVAGEWLGVIATGARGLQTTIEALKSEAARRGRPLRLTSSAEPEAFAALLAGDTAAHDARIAATARRLASEGVDAVVLAQASMSRALPAIGDIGAPVLTSPKLAVGRVAQLIGVTAGGVVAEGAPSP
jgi:Asp/Glu/hydantoin racemase